MLRFLADENFNNDIVRGLRRLWPDADISTVQGLGMHGAADSDVLEWAAANERILLTHDWRTMPGHVRDRLARNEPVSGVLVVPTTLPLRRAIEEVAIVAVCSEPADWRDQIVRLPL
jgi:hypothetical protein